MASSRELELEALLHRARSHIMGWWRPDGELPPAGSPQLIEDIEACLAPKPKSAPASVFDAFPDPLKSASAPV